MLTKVEYERNPGGHISELTVYYSPAEAVLPPALLMDTVYVQTNGDRIVHYVTECLRHLWHTSGVRVHERAQRVLEFTSRLVASYWDEAVRTGNITRSRVKTKVMGRTLSIVYDHSIACLGLS